MASVEMGSKTSGRQLLRSGCRALGKSIARAADWVDDGAARWRYDAVGRSRAISPHAMAAGIVAAGAAALDVVAGPAFGPIVTLGADVAIAGIATHAISRITKRHGEPDIQSVLAGAIARVEREGLCPGYVARGWRIACRVPAAPSDKAHAHMLGNVAGGAAFSLALSGFATTALKKLPWVRAAIRLSRAGFAVATSVRLMAAVEAHAEDACRTAPRVPDLLPWVSFELTFDDFDRPELAAA